MSLPVSAKEIPFVKLLIPFVAGIACQYCFRILTYSWVNFLAILFLFVLTLLGYLISQKWQYRWCFGVFASIFLFTSGIILSTTKPYDQRLQGNQQYRVLIHLLDKPQQRVKSLRSLVEVKYINENGQWSRVDEKILAYFELKDSLALKLDYGSTISAVISPKLVSPPTNPKQFDYKKYLSDRGVGYTVYIKPNEWLFVDSKGFSIRKIALNLRDNLVLLFRKSGLSGDELAVASALTLGYQDLLDDELRQVYSSSGAMHILSVSGLHVGILYVLLTFMLKFLDKKTSLRIVKAIILLSFLWFFALLTGIPPCVQRSALMFSFLVVGDCVSRKSNIYNTIAASAFILLAINPNSLFDIGFQLSYLAVLSIVFFYPFIYGVVYVQNRIIDMVWSLIAVSVAAQVGTFSLCIYYFNQFPNYFILSNLIAIPLSTIALYLSVLLIVVSPFSVISSIVGKAFSFTIHLLNSGLEQIEKMPLSVSLGLHINMVQLSLFVFIIVMISIYIISRRPSHLLASMLGFILFFVINLFGFIERIERNEVVVYNIPHKSLMSFKSNGKLFFVDVDTSKLSFAERHDFYVKGYISSTGSRYETCNPFNSRGVAEIKSRRGVLFKQCNKKCYAIPYADSLSNRIVKNFLMVDYLVVNRFCPEKILDFIKPKEVIIDPSASKRMMLNISAACRKTNTPIYIVAEKGAFVLDN